MDTSVVLLLATVAIVALAALFILASSARRDRAAATGRLSRETRRRERRRGAEPAAGDRAATGREVERAAALGRAGTGAAVVTRPTPPPPAAPTYLDDEALGVTRRQFFNRGITTFFALGLGAFGAASLAFLWPSLSGGFGSKIRVGELDDILAGIRDNKEPTYVPEGRFYLNPYPEDDLDQARQVYTGGVLQGMEEAGLVALYQKCVHLGCRVPWCRSSQWFECPCHGSQYNRVGEKKGGPAPRGLDRFPVELSGGAVSVDTGKLSLGPPIGTNTTGQEAEGPHCT